MFLKILQVDFVPSLRQYTLKQFATVSSFYKKKKKNVSKLFPSIRRTTHLMVPWKCRLSSFDVLLLEMFFCHPEPVTRRSTLMVIKQWGRKGQLIFWKFRDTTLKVELPDTLCLTGYYVIYNWKRCFNSHSIGIEIFNVFIMHLSPDIIFLSGNSSYTLP